MAEQFFYSLLPNGTVQESSRWYDDGSVEYTWMGRKIRMVPGTADVSMWYEPSPCMEVKEVKEEQKSVRLEVVPTHLALDIQGNFYRGLMSGVLLGVVLTLALVAVSIKVLEYLRH